MLPPFPNLISAFTLPIFGASQLSSLDDADSIAGGLGFTARDCLDWYGPRLMSLGEIRLKAALGEDRPEASKLVHQDCSGP
jgi:hypothetical protein